MTRQTYRTIVALWGLLWLAVAAGIGLYVFESWWMVGLGAGIALVLIWGIMSGVVRSSTCCCCWWNDDFHKFDPNDPSRPEYDPT